MTIFDSIKYPISEQPTIEELNNLPFDLFEDWRNYVIKNNGHKEYTTKKAVDLLRYMISVYEEPKEISPKYSIHDERNIQKWRVYNLLMNKMYVEEYKG